MYEPALADNSYPVNAQFYSGLHESKKAVSRVSLRLISGRGGRLFAFRGSLEVAVDCRWKPFYDIFYSHSILQGRKVFTIQVRTVVWPP